MISIKRIWIDVVCVEIGPAGLHFAGKASRLEQIRIAISA
jgi:hypothetical protein